MSVYRDGWPCPTCGLSVKPARRHDCPPLIPADRYVRLNHCQASVNCPLCDWQRDVHVGPHGVVALCCLNPDCRRQKLYRLDRWDQLPTLPAPSRFNRRSSGPFNEGDTFGT